MHVTAVVGSPPTAFRCRSRRYQDERKYSDMDVRPNWQTDVWGKSSYLREQHRHEVHHAAPTVGAAVRVLSGVEGGHPGARGVIIGCGVDGVTMSVQMALGGHHVAAQPAQLQVIERHPLEPTVRNSGHVDCGNQILVDETNEDMTTRMLARLSEDSNRR